MKRVLIFFIAISIFLSLCGCGFYEKEYVSIKDYEPSEQTHGTAGETEVIANYSALKRTLLAVIRAGTEKDRIVFDDSYPGDVSEDLSSACWEIRTENALCAYCVGNISYDTSYLVTHYEADISVAYAPGFDVNSVITSSYIAGASKYILDAYNGNKPRTVLLISNGSYSADEISELCLKTYRDNPLSCILKPQIEVNLFSGAGHEKLYEINIDYLLQPSEIEADKDKLENFDYGMIGIPDDSSDELAAFYILQFLHDNAVYDPDSGYSSAYSALIEKRADSEGLAMAYVALCNKFGIECEAVEGQKNWNDHFWNIVGIDKEYFHADVSASYDSDDLSRYFLANDSSLWGSYRWDTSSYPSCSAAVSFSPPEVTVPPEDTETTAENLG